MFEKGVVKFFDSRDNRRFGFLRLESGEEIFFHFNDGMSMRAGKDQPEWCDPPPGKRLWDPKANDVLVFERKMGKKGPKASPWTHEMLYENAMKVINNRPRTGSCSKLLHEGRPLVDPKSFGRGLILKTLL